MTNQEETPRIEQSDVNPSANPECDLNELEDDTTSSHFSRDTPQSAASNQQELDSLMVEELKSNIVIPQIENEIVAGKAQKSIVHMKVSQQSESNVLIES